MRFPPFFLLFAVLSILAPSLSAQQAPPAGGEPIRRPSGPVLVNGMAAKVNGDVITMNELMIKVAPLQSVLMARFPRRGDAYQEQVKSLRNQVLDDLIDRTIIYTEFKDRVRSFPDHQIEAEVQRIIQNVYNGDEALFRRYLKATYLSRDQFKEQQRKELLVQIVRSQHFGDVPPPTDAEMRKEYKEWAMMNRDRKKDIGTYRRIFVPKRDRDNFSATPESQLKLAEDIAKQLNNGGAFEALAKKYSKDSKAAKGGLWEEIPRTDLNREFGFILFESEGNDVMGPIEDPIGFNIIKVIKRDFGPAKPYSEVRDVMRQRVESAKKKDNFEKWMKKMRTRAMIEKMIK